MNRLLKDESKSAKPKCSHCHDSKEKKRKMDTLQSPHSLLLFLETGCTVNPAYNETARDRLFLLQINSASYRYF
jgi:hypothetical protein